MLVACVITAEVNHFMAGYAYCDVCCKIGSPIPLDYYRSHSGHALVKSFVAWPSLFAFCNRV